MIELLSYAMVFVVGIVVLCLPGIIGEYLGDSIRLKTWRPYDDRADAADAKRLRKEQIWHEMQQAKNSHAEYPLPDDWDD